MPRYLDPKLRSLIQTLKTPGFNRNEQPLTLPECRWQQLTVVP